MSDAIRIIITLTLLIAFFWVQRWFYMRERDAYGIRRRDRHTAPGHWHRICNCEKCVTWPKGRP